MKVYFSWKTSDKNFKRFRPYIEDIIDHFNYPTLEEIKKEDKFFLFFNKWISYVIWWDQVIIKDEIKFNPKEYYPEGWDFEKWDPIPADTVNKILAAKLWIDWELFRDILNNKSDFYCYKEKESYKEKVFNPSKEKLMTENIGKTNDYLKDIISSLKPWQLLIITRTDDAWMFKWKWIHWIPNWDWRWVNNNWDVFWWEFVDWVANWEGYVKFSDGMEFKWIWKNGVMKADWWDWKWTVTFHIEDLNFDNLWDISIVQKNKDWWMSVFTKEEALE